LILYHDLQGKFLIGEKFRSGKLTAYVRPAKTVNKKYKGNQLKEEQTYNCEFIVIEYWYQDCRYSSIDGAPLGCDPPVVYDVEVIAICEPTDPGSGGSPSDPCISSIGPVTISVVGPDPDVPTEPTDPGVPCPGEGVEEPSPGQTPGPLAKLVEQFCDNMTANLKNKVELALSEYIAGFGIPERGCVQAYIYHRLSNLPSPSKFSICMDPNKAQGAFSPATLTMTFKYESSIDYRILGEEMFHAFQNSYYPGGTNQYGDIGFSNIEFEHALFRDITAGSMSALAMSRSTDQVLKATYVDWLKSITQNDTKFPTSFTAEQEATYFYFLDKFRELYIEYNKPVNLGLKPGAMFDIFSKTTNCK
jgi:hypothetical protein